MRRLVGAMHRKTPPMASRQIGQTLTMGSQPGAIFGANPIDATNHLWRFPLQALEADAAIKGQGFLGRIKHLQ